MLSYQKEHIIGGKVETNGAKANGNSQTNEKPKKVIIFTHPNYRHILIF